MENMNTFKRKALFTAVVAGLGVAGAGTAEAVYLNPNRAGQVLVYPYYTVQSAGGNSWNTYLSVVNTTTSAKAVKVRILEGKTSAEVLDFNLFLSPNDVWTAAIVPSGTGANDPGMILTADTSCTRPAIDPAGVLFRNFQYDTPGATADSRPGRGLERTREGYVEMIEMGRLTGTSAAFVTHTAAGVPANCAAVADAPFDPVGNATITPPTGGLIGTGTLINVNSGLDATYKADALEAWSDIVQYTDSGVVTPNLANANPPISVVVRSGDLDPVTGASTQITAYRSEFAGGAVASAGAQAVASVFMHNAVLNEYVLDTATGSLTDWVVTQPLKNQFVTTTVTETPYTALATTAGACEVIGFTYFDREERTATASGSDFSPLPPGAAANTMCWESTILAIRNGAAHTTVDTTVSPVLASRNITNVAVTGTFQNGWGRLSFTGTNAATVGLTSLVSEIVNLGTDVGTLGGGVTVTAAPATFFGLPVTGFMVRSFSNATLTCGTAACQGNYGGLFQHSYATTITP
jgi:hypothetical protein